MAPFCVEFACSPYDCRFPSGTPGSSYSLKTSVSLSGYFKFPIGVNLHVCMVSVLALQWLAPASP